MEEFPVTGFLPMHHLLTEVGIFGNNIPDIALLLEIMSGSDGYDSTVLQGEKYILSTTITR